MVRVVRQPGGTVNGISLDRYKVGQTYEMDPLLADYLVVNGFAMVEMRRGQRSRRPRLHDRRRNR